jgi:RNA polymerase sigma-70 factor (ECF subfamily)
VDELAHRIEVSSQHSSRQCAADPWLIALRGTGAVHDQAVDALHRLLAHAARSEVARRWTHMAYVDDENVDAVAAQAADDAFIALLARLDDFRGDSRFMTWACKFAVLEAGAQARIHAWRRRDVVLDCVGWTRLVQPAATVEGGCEDLELLDALADAIDLGLTSHQRCVLIALAIDEVPIDVLADRLNTTRGALYQTLHDARRQLRTMLLERGLAAETA